MKEKDVPIKDKAFLTLEEASCYFGIGVNKLRTLTNDPCSPYVIWVGTKRLIKRKKLEQHLDNSYEI